MLNQNIENDTDFKRFIPYNTGTEKLALPEYGRLVHQMANAALTIEDIDLRTEFAQMVIDLMKSVMQDKNKDSDDKKYWDHLHIITDFKLQINGPYPAPEPEVVNKKPAKVPYTTSSFGRRHYGLTLQKMIEEVARMENSEQKDYYVDLLSNHIKKLLTLNNPENANDEHVFKDLAEMSEGQIVLSPEMFSLLEFKEDKLNKSNKKKK